MNPIFENVALAIIGLANGLIVGSGLVAFITVLDIVPRLHQIVRMSDRIAVSEYTITAGAVFWTCADFFDWHLAGPGVLQVVIGLFAGCFVGMLAAALTEVLNVLPILTKRLRLQEWLLYILMAMVLGKVLGSLFQWTVF